MLKKIGAYVANALGIDTGKGSAGLSRDLPPSPQMQHVAHQAAAGPPAPRGLPPRPRWQPTITVDIERTARTFACYMDGKHSFVVLKNGTCVLLPPEGTTNPQAAAEKTLRDILWAHPDTKLRTMNDGNFLILYSQPTAATVMFADVVEANWAYIEKNYSHGLTESEVLRGPDGKPAQFTKGVKVNLFGRAYMFMDAVSPEVVKVWHPNKR